MTQQQLIVHDFNLPDHSIELCDAENAILNLKKTLEIVQQQESISDTAFIVLYEEIIKVLDFVGRLSVSAFNIEDELQALYEKQYRHFPELSKKLWQDHYGSIHHPYNILKKRCFNLLQELDDKYRALYKKDPPNWKY